MKNIIHTKTVSWNSIAALFVIDEHAHTNYQWEANVNINHGIYLIAYSQKQKGKKAEVLQIFKSQSHQAK